MAPSAHSSDGLRIAFEVAGEGSPATVLVHGFACDRTYWREQVPVLARRHRVVTLDLAGHGESEGGRRDPTMAPFGADVAAVVDACGLDSIVLVGHSMGGDVILEAAPLLGSRVRGLVWVDTYGSLEDPMTPAEADAFAAPFRTDFAGETRRFIGSMFRPDADPVLRDWIVEDMAAAPLPTSVLELIHAIANQAPAAARVRELRVPLVEISPDLRATDVQSLRAHGIATVIVPDTGHFLMLEAPDRFNAVLEGVLAGFS